MAKEVYMPALGMNQETGTLLRWLKAEGESVTKGEPLMEVATDKTDVEIEAPVSGVLRNVTAQEGDEIPVGQVIALIAKPDEVIAPPKAAAPAAPAASSPAIPAEAPSAPKPSASPAPAASMPGNGTVAPMTPVAARMVADHGIDVSRIQPAGSRIQKEDVLAYLATQTQTGGRVLASPKARRLADEAGIELALIPGSGPEGAVLAEDVLAAISVAEPLQPVLEPAEAERIAAPVYAGETSEVPMSRMWKVMAERLTQSWTTVPHFFLARDVDAKKFKKWHSKAQDRAQSKLTYTDLLVKVVAQALHAHARINASWIDGRIVANKGIHIGLAVAVEDGLLVPVIRNADRLGLEEIAQARADLVARAQAGKLAVGELQDGTFTISNLGMFGIDQFSAIINPPQAAILAVGRIADRVVAVDGKAKVRPMLTLNLSADHRVVDGARAARFLDAVAGMIENPIRILD
ncbi:MAG: 2-oxo acid dehydrogenase subunit E2 [Caldilineaceae bacterium]|nr:2-oxo acid dehydrogenase subunit E2 [Caldilineaceae bacterium]